LVRVNPSLRNQGVGSKLLLETEKLAKEDGMTSIIRLGMFCDAESGLSKEKSG